MAGISYNYPTDETPVALSQTTPVKLFTPVPRAGWRFYNPSNANIFVYLQKVAVAGVPADPTLGRIPSSVCPPFATIEGEESANCEVFAMIDPAASVTTTTLRPEQLI